MIFANSFYISRINFIRKVAKATNLTINLGFLWYGVAIVGNVYKVYNVAIMWFLVWLEEWEMEKVGQLAKLKSRNLWTVSFHPPNLKI